MSQLKENPGPSNDDGFYTLQMKIEDTDVFKEWLSNLCDAHKDNKLIYGCKVSALSYGRDVSNLSEAERVIDFLIEKVPSYVEFPEQALKDCPNYFEAS